MTVAPGALAAAFQHYQAGRIIQAETLCRQILAHQPNQADALFLSGLIAQRQQQPERAIALISQAIALNRKNPDYHNGLGMAYHALGRLEDAAQSYRRAITLRPAHADAHYNFGNLCEARGDIAAAVQSFRRAVLHDSSFVEALFNLANALHRLGEPEAAEIYRRALALHPNYVEAHNNLGVVLRAQNDPTAAADSFRRALALAPRFAKAQANLGNVLLELGRTAEALAASRQAVALDPGSPGGHSDFIFNMNFDDRIGPEEHQAERRRWSERHGGALPAVAVVFPDRDLAPNRRLRIGYVSAHFRAYAATYAFGGVLLNHRPEEFEMFCYSDGRREDALTPLFRARADQWRDITALSDDAAASLVREDRIDILVDLVGHQVGQRLLVFARKPAPIQITAWGEPTGTGLAAMDYIFADPVLIPPAQRPLLAERVIDLPGALGHWMPDALPEPGPLPALSRGYPTFGSFNRRGKITAAVIACWAELLRAIPGARLVLKNKLMDRSAQRAALSDAFAVGGIAPERLTLLGATSHTDHFAAYQQIDIALDPFPHSGGMTTLDALAMGVPVVTWSGRTIISRLAASCLAALDLRQFIAPDLAGYIDIAVKATRNLDVLAELRASLREHLQHSAIGDPVRYARAVEAAYRQAWQEYCAKATPRA